MATVHQVPAASHEKQVIAYASAIHALMHGLELTYAAVLIAIASEFGTGLFLLGAIANVFALAFGSGAIPAGFLADRFGSRRILFVCLIASAAMAGLVSLSPNLPILAITMTGLGLATGLYHPTGLSFITREVRRRALGIGYHGMAGNLGVGITPVMAAGIAATLGWRAAYIFLGVIALALAFLLLRFSRRGEVQLTGNPEEPAASASYPEQLLLGRLLIVYVANTLAGFIYRGTVTFLPLYITQRVHINLWGLEPVVLGGSFASAALLLGVLGQYVGGHLADRIKLETLVVPATAVLIPSLLVMGLSGELVLVSAAGLFAFFNFMGQPTYNSLVAAYTPRRLQGRSYGFAFFAGFGVGSFSAGFSGLIAERLGTNWVFLTLAGVAFVMLLLASYLRWAPAGQQAQAQTASADRR